MRTTRLLVLVAMVVTTGAWACDSDGGDPTDTTVADAADVPAPQDNGTDEGQPEDPGTPDPGKTDTAKPDTTPVDNGPVDNGPADVGPTCPAVVVPEATCTAIAACAIQCAEASHQAACLGSATGAEADKWTALKACLDTAACPKVFENEQFTECAATACKDTLQACFQGTDTCREVWICRKACDENDPSCLPRCLGNGTVEAQATFIAYKDCILGVDCAETDVRANGWPTEECEKYGQNHNCPLQAQACFPPT